MLSHRRRIAAAVLGFGAFAGFCSGVHGLMGHGGFRERHHARFEDRVADVCTRAAERVYAEHDRKGAGALP